LIYENIIYGDIYANKGVNSRYGFYVKSDSGTSATTYALIDASGNINTTSTISATGNISTTSNLSGANISTLGNITAQ
jgi:hypothetical protein